jgi:hypothetical protein
MNSIVTNMMCVLRGAAFLALLAGAAPAAAQVPSPSAAQTPSGSDRPALFSEPRVLTKAISWVENFGRDETGRVRDGFYPELGHMITGAGWVAAGPGYRRHLFGGRALVDASASLSWRAYKIAQASVELPYLHHDRFKVGVHGLWHDYTQVGYFGTGGESLEAGATDYRVKATDIVAYAQWTPASKLSVTGAGGWLARPALLASAGPFDRDRPDTMVVYATDPAASLLEQPTFLHAAGAVAYDSRDHASYPTAGGLYRVGAATYRDREADAFDFGRFEVEAARFVPLVRNRGVLALHWWTVLSHTRTDQAVPFYFLPGLGGHNTLRGYADYRFHDRHMMAVTVESRWVLWPHVDAAVFFDAGNVAAKVRDLDVARTSAGFGLRVHTSTTTLARFDVGRSKEGWRFMLKLSDPLRFARLHRRTAPLPFVP